MFQVESFKIVGRSNRRWGQVYSQDGLFLLLELAEEAQIGRQVIEKIAEKYQNLRKKNLQTIKQLFPKDLEEDSTSIIGVLRKNILYLVAQGKGVVRIKRGKVWGKVLSGKGSASGVLQAGDILVLSSPTFEKLVSEKLEKLLNRYSLNAAGEHLASRLQAAEENEGAACLLLQFSQKQRRGSPQLAKIIKKIKFFLLLFRKLKTTVFRQSGKLPKGKRLTASLGFFLAFLLIGSLFFGNFQKQKRQQNQQAKRIKEEVLPKIEEGRALLDLNIFQARRVLSLAKKTLEEIIPNLEKNSKQRREAEKLLAEVKQTLQAARRVFKISKAPLFFDLSWIKEGAKGSSLALYKNSLVILDKKGKSIYQLNIKSKRAKILGGGEVLGEAKKIALHSKKVFILLGGENPKIVNSSSQVVIENDKEWGEIADLVAYAGNLYLLDKGGAIWKYPASALGFGQRRNYLAADIKPDFSSATSMSIDGAVWVLNGGVLTKFVQGVPENFSLQEEEGEIEKPRDFFTNEESENLYLLDGAGKIIVFDKRGRYRAQYSWEGLSQITDFVVAENLKKILLLLDGKIYGIDIK